MRRSCSRELAAALAVLAAVTGCDRASVWLEVERSRGVEEAWVGVFDPKAARSQPDLHAIFDASDGTDQKSVGIYLREDISPIGLDIVVRSSTSGENRCGQLEIPLGADQVELTLHLSLGAVPFTVDCAAGAVCPSPGACRETQ